MKGVIVAAGYGTRFLPVTKTVPKEMLPLINKPSLAFILEEFAASGIEDVIIISSRRKKVMEDYVDREVELESVFNKEGKADKAALVQALPQRIFFTRQTEMRGTGHALLQVRAFVGNDPCVVAYPDDLHFGSPALSAQLIESYRKTGCSVLATQNEPGDVSRYGVLKLGADNLHVTGFVEKPAPGTEPSHEISIGRYLYTPDFFDYLEEGWKKHQGGGEYYHLYALEKLMAANKVVYKRFYGTRLDTGEPSGYLEAILTYAWQDPKLRACVEGFVSKQK
jgi:UTP--glucose-1-phosphate uridylyltransferase